MKNKECSTNKVRVVISLVLAVVFALGILLLPLYASASEEYNLNKYNYTVSSDILQKISRYMQTHDNNSIQVFSNYFTKDALEFVNGYTYGSTDINTDNVIAYTVDYIEPSNSSTGDTVYFVNMKFKIAERNFNIVKTYEFHINSDGKIYGINVWQF